MKVAEQSTLPYVTVAHNQICSYYSQVLIGFVGDLHCFVMNKNMSYFGQFWFNFLGLQLCLCHLNGFLQL